MNFFKSGKEFQPKKFRVQKHLFKSRDSLIFFSKNLKCTIYAHQYTRCKQVIFQFKKQTKHNNELYKNEKLQKKQ